MQKSKIKIKEQSKQPTNEIGYVKPRTIIDEMQESYLDYAMSVIVDRALPDVRDGLKPVHRRILVTLNDLGLRARGRFRKSAKIAGDVSGNYHPHGEAIVYPSMVHLAQNFKMRYPLVNGQGNFGSMDGDPPAAMRYTEARMAVFSEEILTDLEKKTVNWRDNYDNTKKEPSVLPARLPNLIINGSIGIAVGMATNIPPHNLTEVCEAISHLIDNPEATVDDLMKYIKGPDFPTGADIFNVEDIKTAYATGKGRVLMRAKANIEEKNGERGYKVIISEIPYQVNKAELISKIAELVKMKKLDGISDIRDESDRKEGVRIVIELKANAYPQKILNQLYKLTQMQSVFHVNMLALIDGIQPRVLTLKNILEEYIKHRKEIIIRRVKYDLDKAKARAHILEGLKKALDHIDEIIATIKKSETKEIAHKKLMEQFSLSDKQAEAILEMRLSALAGLERKKIDDELTEKKALIEKLEKILANSQAILDIIKKEMKYLKEKYGDKRRTTIHAQEIGGFADEDLVPDEEVVITLTKSNYIKRIPVATFRSQGRGGRGVRGMETKDADEVSHMATCSSLDRVFFFTNEGRIFSSHCYEIPASSRQSKGQALVNIIQLGGEEKVTAIITAPRNMDYEKKYFVMGTKKGVVKKTPLSAYEKIRKSGMIAIKLNIDDSLRWVKISNGGDSVIYTTKNGLAIHFKESDVRSMGRSAAGVRGIRLREGDQAISMDIIKAESENASLLVVLENGYGKRTLIHNFKIQKRGGYGVKAVNVNSKTGKAVRMRVEVDNDGDVIIVSRSGQVIRTPLKKIRKLGRATQGVRLIRLKQGDKVASVTVARKKISKSDNNDKTNNDNSNDNSAGDKGDKNENEYNKKLANPTAQPVNNKPSVKKTTSPKSSSSSSLSFSSTPASSPSKIQVSHYQKRKKETIKKSDWFENSKEKEENKNTPNYWGGDTFRKRKI